MSAFNKNGSGYIEPGPLTFATLAGLLRRNKVLDFQAYASGMRWNLLMALPGISLSTNGSQINAYGAIYIGIRHPGRLQLVSTSGPIGKSVISEWRLAGLDAHGRELVHKYFEGVRHAFNTQVAAMPDTATPQVNVLELVEQVHKDLAKEGIVDVVDAARRDESEADLGFEIPRLVIPE